MWYTKTWNPLLCQRQEGAALIKIIVIIIIIILIEIDWQLMWFILWWDLIMYAYQFSHSWISNKQCGSTSLINK